MASLNLGRQSLSQLGLHTTQITIVNPNHSKPESTTLRAASAIAQTQSRPIQSLTNGCGASSWQRVLLMEAEAGTIMATQRQFSAVVALPDCACDSRLLASCAPEDMTSDKEDFEQNSKENWVTEVHNTEKGNNNKFLFAMDIGLTNEHAVPFFSWKSKLQCRRCSRHICQTLQWVTVFETLAQSHVAQRGRTGSGHILAPIDHVNHDVGAVKHGCL